MEADTYMLLHRMLEVATTKREINIALRQFQAIVDTHKGSTVRDELFDAAWAMSCIASLYLRLNQPDLAERNYRDSIQLFDKNGMAIHSAVLCLALAKHFAQQGRMYSAELELRQNIAYLKKYWGSTNHHVLAAKEELRHFQSTGRFILACHHNYCKACGVDKYGIGFEQDGMQDPRP